MRQLGLEFRLIRPDAGIEEHLMGRATRSTPRGFALACARAKALSASLFVRSGIVVGVDTVVAVNGRILGKPRNRADARRMLRLLSGRTHTVTSGVAVVRMPDRLVLTGTETTRVAFRQLSDREIERYIATPEPYDKAGAYGIQELAGIFVRSVSGCYLNVVGLPVELLLSLLKQVGYRPA